MRPSNNLDGRGALSGVYLGKDSHLEAPTFRAMYPAIDRWLAVKARYDPQNVFTSARRPRPVRG